jgi:glycine cleavage system H protein
MGEGWFIKVKLSDISELDDLMDESAYQAFIED